MLLWVQAMADFPILKGGVPYWAFLKKSNFLVYKEDSDEELPTTDYMKSETFPGTPIYFLGPKNKEFDPRFATFIIFKSLKKTF